MISQVAQRTHTSSTGGVAPGSEPRLYEYEIHDQFYLGAAGSSSLTGEMGIPFLDDPILSEIAHGANMGSEAVVQILARVEYSTTIPALELALVQGARLPRLVQFEALSTQYRRWTERLEALLVGLLEVTSSGEYLETIERFRLPIALPPGDLPATALTGGEAGRPHAAFIDEQGAPLSFVSMEEMTQEELEEAGFPYYSPSDESEEVRQSLLEIYRKSQLENATSGR